MPQTFVVIRGVQSPKTPAPKAVGDRITQIRHEIRSEHWERLTRTRPIALPYSND